MNKNINKSKSASDKTKRRIRAGMYRGAWGFLGLGIQEGPPRGGDLTAARLSICQGPEGSVCLGEAGLGGL